MDGSSGHGYAHEYDGWLALFKMLACASLPFALDNVPSTWAPFLADLGHHVRTVGFTRVWDCETFDWLGEYKRARDKRRVVEIASTCRPELVHALYCADTEWPCPLRGQRLKREFPVTCNGSFFRPEVQQYRARLEAYDTFKSRCVIVPCAAEKPYPSATHREVMRRLPDNSWHLIIATGVLGLVPQELWDDMPLYDSGIPNLQRVTDTVRWYFSRHAYDAIVVYSDFYASAVRRGLQEANTLEAEGVHFVLGSHPRDTYENLTLPEHLDRLEQAMRQHPSGE